MPAVVSLQVDKELGEDIYFYKEGNGKWTLSIYKPLKWGIAGTAQIAEDVVSTCYNPHFWNAVHTEHSVTAASR